VICKHDTSSGLKPEASKIALTADFPNITIAGNVANQVFPTKEFLEEVHSVPNPYSELFYVSSQKGNDRS
jgi:inosine-uridine nucleoside N-ribohydrolase